MGSRVLRIVLAIVAAAGLILVPGASSTARAKLPSVGLISVIEHVEVVRFPGEPIFLPGGVFLAALDGAFELWATNQADGTVDVKQVVRKAGEPPAEVRHLPLNPNTTMWQGLADFLRLTWSDENGNVLTEQTVPFCPASWDVSRTNDTGPGLPTYPSTCGSHLTQRMIWGIDQGWAIGALSSTSPEDPGLEDGEYRLDLSIEDAYADVLEVPASKRHASIGVTLTTFDFPPCPPEDPFCGFRSAGASDEPGSHRGAGNGRSVNPRVPAGASGLPDLRALPAFALETASLDGSDFLNFAANVWNAGPGPLVVEGFRPGNALSMPATQYFFTNGKVSGKASVGSFVFHEASDHFHWHFEDFAGYDLLKPDGSTVVVSGKQSFCLVPTDPIDLTVPGALLQPERIGFYTACGAPDSIWIREVMPAGWGDTYFQFLTGQALDITNVPNGDYLVRVKTNANQNLKETDYTNNEALRHVTLRGRPGNRIVEVS